VLLSSDSFLSLCTECQISTARVRPTWYAEFRRFPCFMTFPLVEPISSTSGRDEPLCSSHVHHLYYATTSYHFPGYMRHKPRHKDRLPGLRFISPGKSRPFISGQKKSCRVKGSIQSR
jgi:hypothetical protein